MNSRERRRGNAWQVAVLALATAVLMLSGAAQAAGTKKSVSDQILDILLEKKIITQEKYLALRRQVLAEQAARKKEQNQRYQLKYRPAKGLSLERNDGSHGIALTGRLQLDAKAFTSDSGDNASFFVRRARIAARIRWHTYFRAFVELEMGKGKTGLNDGFLEIYWRPALRLRFGQFKQPFGMEEMHSDNWIWTMERSLGDSLVPSRDIGFMVHGSLAGGAFYYAASLYNGSGKNDASDTEGSKDLAGRVVAAPLRWTGGGLFKDFYLGAAATWGNQEASAGDWWRGGKLVTAAGNTWFLVDPSVRQNGARTRLGGELFWSVGPVAFMGELARTDFDGLELDGNTYDLSIWGGYAMASWLITGEHADFKGGKPSAIKPRRNFELGKSGGWGAWQAVLRYDWLKADSGWLDYGLVNRAAYSDQARGWTAGLNWYLNDMVRLMLNFFDYRFEQPVTIHSLAVDKEQGFLGRIQIVY